MAGGDGDASGETVVDAGEGEDGFLGEESAKAGGGGEGVEGRVGAVRVAVHDGGGGVLSSCSM